VAFGSLLKAKMVSVLSIIPLFQKKRERLDKIGQEVVSLIAKWTGNPNNSVREGE
jgi:hypothetical protein